MQCEKTAAESNLYCGNMTVTTIQQELVKAAMQQ
jgi:hypothetical protein